MNFKFNIPSSVENKAEFENWLHEQIESKLLDRAIDKSKIVSLTASMRKTGIEYKFNLSLKYGKANFQVIKKAKDPFAAAGMAIKGMKRICIDNSKIKNIRPIGLSEHFVNLHLSSPTLNQDQQQSA